ncbi:MAG TPA: response regulator [Roseiflexaceae bacterium]|nr:response regulator [Roseiflexaceae bacterium]HMP40153.1 response regulator [Roseiflexaceae bacterium]
MAHRLLIVPGDSDELRGLAEHLTGGVATQVFESANDALWEVRNSPPDAIIANVQLDGMSGLDIAEILPNFGVDTRVLLWSRTGDLAAAQQAASLGVYRYLSGQASTDDLHDAVHTALRDVPVPVAPAEPAAAEPVTPAEPVAPAEPPNRRAPERAGRTLAARAARDRTEQPAATPPAEPAAPAPAPAERPFPRRRDGGALVLTPEDLHQIRLRMESLDRDVGSRCILLADRAGMVLAETGHSQGLPTMVLLPLLSTSFSTAGQITQMLNEKESSALYVHEGTRFDLYCFDVMQRFMLVIVFEKSATSAKIGSVWVYAKRAIRDIQQLLK